jgi:hypothetical protein
MNPARVWLLAALALSTSVGCGANFDPSNEIKSLRVLGVKKDKPYAQPGDTVNLQMLWTDPKGHDQVQTAFIGGCVNPPGDLYYGCFDAFGSSAAPGNVPFSFGDTFSLTLPTDIISGRQGPIRPGQARYGLYIVFFALCGGTLSLDPDADPTAGLPLRCLDADGNPLGSDDFVVGYSSIYSFEGVSNENPSFTLDADGSVAFQVASASVPSDCVGEACQGAPVAEVDCDATPERCIEACADDGDPGCPTIDVAPAIAEKIEKDQVSSDLFRTNVTEQMWVNYYVDHGSINEVRLVNDSNSGWNPKYRGQLRAPKDKGPLQIWAVVHDNRGGMDFTRVTLQVE